MLLSLSYVLSALCTHGSLQLFINPIPFVIFSPFLKVTICNFLDLSVACSHENFHQLHWWYVLHTSSGLLYINNVINSEYLGSAYRSNWYQGTWICQCKYQILLSRLVGLLLSRAEIRWKTLFSVLFRQIILCMSTSRRAKEKIKTNIYCWLQLHGTDKIKCYSCNKVDWKI